MMEMAVLKNRAPYDRKWFGTSIVIEPGENALEPEEFRAFNQNCVLFQQMTNPPEYGGEPAIKVVGSDHQNNVILNATGIDRPTTFTAPRICLRGNDVTKIPKKYLTKLRDDNRFQKLVQEGEIIFLGWNE